MSAHRLRRWPNIETALGEWPVFAGEGLPATRCPPPPPAHLPLHAPLRGGPCDQASSVLSLFTLHTGACFNTVRDSVRGASHAHHHVYRRYVSSLDLQASGSGRPDSHHSKLCLKPGNQTGRITVPYKPILYFDFFFQAES